MDFKIDTKEKFSVISPQMHELSANLTEDLRNLMLGFLQKPIPHLVLNLEKLMLVNEGVGTMLGTMQQQFLEADASLVTCCLQPEVKAKLDDLEILDILNWAPTESEAWDIVQMEEVERELLNGDFED